MTSHQRWKVAQRSEKTYWQLYKVTTSKKRQNAMRCLQYASILRKHVKIDSGTNILDIGCGPDGMINYVDGHRYAVDPLMDYYFLEFRMSKDINCMKGVGEAIPLKDECLDILIATNALDHTQNPASMIKEMNRTLKSEGILFLTVHCYGLLTAIARRIDEKLQGRTGKADQYHPHTFLSRDVLKQLQESDFAIEASVIRTEATNEVSCNRRKLDVASYLNQCCKNPINLFYTFARWIADRTSYSRVDMIFIAIKQ